MANVIDIVFGLSEPSQIGSITVDATISEDHKFTNRVTDFPIEDNAFISDHVIQVPEQLTLKGFITNSPIEYASGLRSGIKPERVNDAFIGLMQIAGYDYPLQPASPSVVRNSAKLVSVVTGLRSYDNMIVSSLSVPRNDKTGNSMEFTITLKHVNETKVEVETVLDQSKISDQIYGAKKQGAKKVNEGVEKVVEIQEESIIRKGLVELINAGK